MRIVLIWLRVTLKGSCDLPVSTYLTKILRPAINTFKIYSAGFFIFLAKASWPWYVFCKLFVSFCRVFKNQNKINKNPALLIKNELSEFFWLIEFWVFFQKLSFLYSTRIDFFTNRTFSRTIPNHEKKFVLPKNIRFAKSMVRYNTRQSSVREKFDTRTVSNKNKLISVRCFCREISTFKVERFDVNGCIGKQPYQTSQICKILVTLTSRLFSLQNPKSWR